MSVITAIIDFGSIFVLSISGIFILTFCPRAGFWNFSEEVAFIFFACFSSPSQAYFGLLPAGVGKCQHLPTSIGKSPKWNR
jgi:hypothetical protein